MNANLTEIVFILDRSGSMSGLELDTIGGYNSTLLQQKEVPGDALVTTILFDDEYEILHDRVDIKSIKEITRHEYYVRGATALLDAMGRTINYIGKVLSKTEESMRPSKVLFVVITDGHENASREFNYNSVKTMIEHQKSKYSWEFIFLGANIDSFGVARDLGIDMDKTVNYRADSKGVKNAYDSINYAISSLRVNSLINEDWKNDVDEDYKNRKKENE